MISGKWLGSILLPVKVALLFLCVGPSSGSVAQADDYQFHHENVLGTSFSLRVIADSPEVAAEAEGYALREIDRLSEIYSGYSATSELANFIREPVGKKSRLSTELGNLLGRCEYWRKSSEGAFNPAVELLTRRWKLAAQHDQLPSDIELELLAQLVNDFQISLDPQTNLASRSSDLPLSLNAIAKGTILDWLAEQLTHEIRGLRGLALEIGGDVRLAGEISQLVHIADPSHDALGGPPRSSIRLQHGAIATSGLSERSLRIADKKFSHVIDPRSGQPCDHIRSATVIANTAEAADVLATICCVLPVEKSLAIVEAHPGAACLLVDREGSEFKSGNWSSLSNTSSPKLVNAPLAMQAEAKHQFKLSFEIAKSTQGGRYRRPYVAAWVEDADGFPVKTLALFLMTDNPGPRWHRDLRRWYSSEQMRALVDKNKLIGVISKPTRNPGEYKVEWDAQDDNGKPLNEGKYTLFIEAAREHGTYQLMKYPFEIGGAEFTKELQGNVEIKSATMTYEKQGSPKLGS